ncbi:MAG: hypothetical protein M4579_007353 [Chaenotheca gracillima]|nr:MAG: hypothetical protein M4579_007353 [Chaenotheca gracillima]
MIIYKDIITGDELLSETYDVTEIDGVIYEVETKRVPESDNIEVNFGGNPSENPDETDTGIESGGGGQDDVKMVYELCKSFQLGEVEDERRKNVPITKGQFDEEFKRYVKKVKAALEKKGTDPAEVKVFTDGVKKHFKRISKNIENCDTFTGSTDDLFEPSGMRVVVDYRDDGMTPYAIIWKHGLEEMKV